MNETNEGTARTRDMSRRVQTLFQLELLLVVVCWVLVLMAVLAWFVFQAPVNLVISLGLPGGACGLAALIVSRRMKRLYTFADANMEQARKRIRQREERLRRLAQLLEQLQQAQGAAVSQTPQKLPCAIGFANLGGDACRELAEQDAAELAPLFERSRTVVGHVTVAEVLFVYAALLEDGTLEGTNGAGLRQIVDLTGAKIVVLASPNPAERVHLAAALPGPAEHRAANLVFTIDRNEENFVRYFKEFFGLMRDCGDMPAAWGQLEGRFSESGRSDAPQVLLIAEEATAPA